MGVHFIPLTLKQTLAVTRRPSHVSTADPSSRQTRHPTVAPSVNAATAGFTGVHHCPATRTCPVVQRPHDPCHAPTKVLLGISSVDSPIDRVVIMVCCIESGPEVLGKTNSSMSETGPLITSKQEDTWPQLTSHFEVDEAKQKENKFLD